MSDDKGQAIAARLEAAAEHLSARRYRQCHEHCIAAIKLNPHIAEPYYLLGILTADHQNFTKALELFERALAAAPNDARYLAQQAKCLSALSRQQDASDAADRAVRANPVDAFTFDTIGVVMSHVGRHDDALEFFRRAIALEPDNAGFQYNLGSALQFAGDFDNAQAALGKSLEIDPDNYRAYTSLTALKKQTLNHNFIDNMKTLFARSNDPDKRLQLGHALAKSFEDLEDYEQALSWLSQAKARKRETLNYSFSEHEKVFDAAERLSCGGVQSMAAKGDANPIFIVGMPRTGTTLVDRILSSHAAVVSVGELTNFGLISKQAAKTSSPFVLDAETLEKAAALNLKEIGGAYLESTRRLRGDASYFVDKMPLNFFYAPLLLKALPSARVIVLRRHPMDACLSNFRQLFRTSYSYYNYAYDLDDTARFYARFDRLMAIWRKELPPARFMEIAYEDIVEDQEEKTRALIDFCGFTWMDQCLNFHENAAPVATASSVQVRSPIYSSSMGRWRRYGAALDGLRARLDALGIEIM